MPILRKEGGIKLVTLYTLPTCGICKMIKTKMSQKNISYEEKDLQTLPEKFKTDRAPVMMVDDKIMYSPSEMVQWVNNWGN